MKCDYSGVYLLGIWTGMILSLLVWTIVLYANKVDKKRDQGKEGGK